MAGRRLRRAGFTLIELLLALLLSATLLLTLWRLSSLYLDFFSSGEARTEQAQLLRSLAEQLADDMASAVQDPVGGGRPIRGTAPSRRFGLSGSAASLRVDVIELTPGESEPPALEATSASQSRRTPQVAELKTVYYSFRDPLAATEEVIAAPGEAQGGLVRRELDFETPAEASSGSTTLDGEGEESGLSSDLLEVPLADPSSTSGDAVAPNAALPGGASLGAIPDASVMYAGEVVGLRFRYFDGRTWLGRWDSLRQNGLPIAVEMSLQIATPEAISRLRAAATASEQISADGTIAEAAPPPPAPPTYRVVCYLPGSPLPRATSARPRTARERLAVPQFTPVTPRVTSPGISRSAPQHMRTSR